MARPRGSASDAAKVESTVTEGVIVGADDDEDIAEEVDTETTEEVGKEVAEEDDEEIGEDIAEDEVAFLRFFGGSTGGSEVWTGQGLDRGEARV